VWTFDAWLSLSRDACERVVVGIGCLSPMAVTDFHARRMTPKAAAGHTPRRLGPRTPNPEPPNPEPRTQNQEPRTSNQLRIASHLEARTQTLTRGVDKVLEERCELARPPEVLRVPLDADAELRALLFDCFDDAVGRRG
jgi:hypothetical protein